jgi:hypothetical protein
MLGASHGVSSRLSLEAANVLTLSITKQLLVDIRYQIEALEALTVEDVAGPGSSAKAEASRLLNRLADSLVRAAAETRTVYWEARGYADPLVEQDRTDLPKAPIRPPLQRASV